MPTASPAKVIFADGDAVTGMEAPPFGAGLHAGAITDPKLAWAGARAHNRWLEEFCASNPPRRAGVALVPITHGVEESVKEIYALADKPGIKGIMIPTMWHDAESYGHEKYDPSGRPAMRPALSCTPTRVRPTPRRTTRTWPSTCSRSRSGPTVRCGSSCSREVRQVPELQVRAGRVRVVVARRPPLENRRDVRWHQLEGEEDESRTKGLIERLPSEYVGENVFIGASTMSKVELRRRYVNGIDALMWGTDYPIRRARGPTPSPASRPTSSRSRSRRPASCSASTRSSATTSMNRPFGRSPTRSVPRPSNSTRIRRCAPIPTPSARPAGGSRTTGSPGRVSRRPTAGLDGTASQAAGPAARRGRVA